MTETVTQTEPTPKRDSGILLRVTRRPKTFWQRVREDLPIIVLAAFLSAYIWFSARQEVQVTETITGIRVVADTGGRRSLRADPKKLDLTFRCPKGVFEKIKSEVERDGIVLVIGSEPGIQRSFSYDPRVGGDRYRFDWEKYVVNLVDGKLPLPSGNVTAQREWVVPILPPQVPDLQEGIGVEVVEVEPRQISFYGPATLFPRQTPQVRPNALTRAELGLENGEEATFDRVIEIPLRFGDWVEEKVDEGGKPDPARGLPDAARREVPLPKDAVAQVRLRRIGRRTMSHTLMMAMPYEELDRYVFEVVDIGHVGATAGGTHLEATVVGTKAELDRLHENRDFWQYVIDLPAAERAKLAQLGPGGLPSVTVNARLSLALRGALREELRDVRLDPTPAQANEFVLRVRLRER